MQKINILQTLIQEQNTEKNIFDLESKNYDTLNASPEIKQILNMQAHIILEQKKYIKSLLDKPFDFGNMLLLPTENSYKSRKEVDLHVSFSFPHSEKKASFIPVMASNMDTIGTISMATALRKEEMFTCIHKFYEHSQLNNYFSSLKKEDPDAFNYFAISTGISDQDYQKTTALIDKNPEIQYLCIDVANGYMQVLNDFVQKIRKKYPEITIFVGNIVDKDRAKTLVELGADAVKVGIGSGSVCTTRQEAGVGALQASAVIDCAFGLHELGYGYVISDGGCTNAGNISHAFACGADMVMLGGMLAGHKECFDDTPQIKQDNNGNHYLSFYGMSSEQAMKNHYKDWEKRMEYRASEGRVLNVPYKGDIAKTVNAILGGMRSAMTYTGKKSLHDLRNASYQIGMNNNGLNYSLLMKSLSDNNQRQI